MNLHWPGLVVFQLALVSLVIMLTQAVLGPILTMGTQEMIGKDRAPMVLVPAGDFMMGSPTGRSDEQPPHRVYLDAFYMDKFEVTVSRYGRFIESEDLDPPFMWTEARKGRQGEKPVIGVDWFEAAAYCRWAGKRLPTEAEWEKAARGTDERMYPWGNEAPTPSHANFGHEKWQGYSTLASVGSLEHGKSPFGIYDLAGNVWEWVADRYDETYYQKSRPGRNPKGPPNGPLRALRGGAWDSDAPVLRSANRNGYVPSARRNDIGFRCAQSGP